MAKKKSNRKGEIKMTNEEIKNTEEVVNNEIETAASNEGEENVNNETETTEVVVNNNETVIEPEVQEPNPEDPEVKPEELEVKPADESDDEDQNEIQPDEVKEACVVKCEKLNVRKEASKTAEVVCVISKDAALTVSITKSTEDFYKVYTINNEVLVEGYCVKDFIKIK